MHNQWTRRVVLGVLMSLWAQGGHADLINPGFETGDLTGWSTFSPGWRIGTGADAYEGTYGVVNDVLDGDVDAFRGIFQDVPVVGGESYNGGVWIRAVSINNSESWFEVQWFDSSGGFISQSQSAHVVADQSFTYTGVSGMVAPINAVTGSVRGVVQMHSTVDTPDFHIMDSFEFQVVPEPGVLSLLLLGGLAILGPIGARLRTRRA